MTTKELHAILAKRIDRPAFGGYIVTDEEARVCLNALEMAQQVDELRVMLGAKDIPIKEAVENMLNQNVELLEKRDIEGRAANAAFSISDVIAVL